MQLIKYDAACRALSEARAVDEVKNLRDQAQAISAYARQAKNKQLEIDAAEIRIRAERRLGEMIRQQRETVGLNPGGWTQHNAKSSGSDKEPEDIPPTLASAGIDKKLSSRAQAMASIPEDEFEATLAEHRDEQIAVTGRTMERLAKKAHVANNSGNNEWYTPPKFIAAAREVMGGIDLDPASSDLANQTVEAKTYYTAEDNGLEQKWFGRIWLNPPYAQPLIAHFSDAVVSRRKDYKAACILVNNATDTDWLQNMLVASDAVCLLRGRVKFVDKHGEPTGAPLQGQVIVYMGPDAGKFVEVFSSFGWAR